MARLPIVTGRQLIRALERGGFNVIRIKGSHHFLRHFDDPTRQTVVPVHGSEDLVGHALHLIRPDALPQKGSLEITEFAIERLSAGSSPR